MIMNTLPYGPIRHIFSFLLGAFLLQFTLGVQWIHQLITSLLCYALFLILPRKTTAFLVPAFAMFYLVFGHLHRQYINYLGYDFDFTGAQMVLTQKMYMIAYNLYDGECLARGKENRAAKKCEEFALPKLPGLFEFLGYTFCFSNVLAGPAYEFTTYSATCSGSLLYTPDGKARGKIPSNIWPTLRPFLTCLVALATYVVVGAHFPLLDSTDPQRNTPVVLTKAFLAHPWWYRYAYMWMGLVVVRQKYYFAWKCAEGANNIWYAGFEGFDENGSVKGWEASSNMNIIAFETAPNIQTLSREWNKKTSLWLNRYVYIRTGGSLVAVYSMSAFWHGFYPGYYMFFLSVPLLTFCERLARQKISPYFSAASFTPYDILCRVVTSILVEYMVSPFPLLAFEWSWNNWKSHYFFGHIVCAIAYAVLVNLPKPKGEKEKSS
jgi:MBOAT, membrane-bound O-acyltransferase family